MRKSTYLFALLSIGILFFSPYYCFPQKVSITENNLVTCFPATAHDSAGTGYTCEASAVLYYDKMVYLGSDRDFPGKSAMFTLPFSLPFANYGTDVKVIDQSVINNARKWEDMSISPDKRFIFAITGFDRVKKGSHDWDNFNVLAYWPAGMADSAKILCETDSGGVQSSLILRHRIAKVLADENFPAEMPYFKTEGLCVLPKNRLLFGIREYGQDYDHFSYAFRILQCTYTVNADEIQLNDDMKEIYRIDSLHAYGNDIPLGLSSMEYDPSTGRIWFLTSFENNSIDPPQNGAYLWYLFEEDLESEKKPLPVRNASGQQQQFLHKAEGITVVNSSSLLIICDDDRNLIPLESNIQVIRQGNQSVYYILEVGE